MKTKAYYNEFDPHAAEWLRNLIKAGEIADGIVDERSIKDVDKNDLKGFTQCHFFAGIGGWSYALRLAGWEDSRPVWTGSCPCQPFSNAGLQEGEDDPRHLWPEFKRLIEECRPATVFGEQVASKAGRAWLTRVQTDLQNMGYASAGADICAAGINAPHIRQRLWWVANAQYEQYKGISSKHGIDTTAEKEWQTAEFTRHGKNSRMANSGIKGLERYSRDETDGNKSRWNNQETIRPVTESCDNCRMGNSKSNDKRGSSDRQDGQREQVGRSSGNIRLENSSCFGSSGGGNGNTPGNGGALQTEGSGAYTDYWLDSVFIPCKDGKYRRIKPGVEPLAYGLPKSVGKMLSRIPGAKEDARKAQKNKNIQLKGYGNAIVPQVAVIFIKSYMEIMGELTL